MNDALNRIRYYFHFPSRIPLFIKHTDNHGWFSQIHKDVFSEFLSPKTKLIVELGSWLGKSTRWILDNAPNATVIAVDTWFGSIEHLNGGQYTDRLPMLYNQFIFNCWNYRKRLIPIRQTTSAGLRIVYNQKLSPDIIYIDASHEYWDVRGDIEMSHELFPDSILVGDDYVRDGVNRAVKEFVEKTGYSLYLNKHVWYIRNEKYQKVLR